MLIWNLGGAFARFEVLKAFIEDHTDELSSFCVFDGPRLCPWNGGRVNENVWDTEQQKNYWRDNNVPVCLTFSNPVVDLDNIVGNQLLQDYHGNNYVIAVSDELRSYIRTNFPKYKLVFSITGNSCSEVKLTKQGIDYYKSLEDKWDYIVPRQGHAIQSEFQALDVSRYEVLLNGRCIPGCTFWLKHFGKIAEVNRLYSNPYQQLGQEACENLYRRCYYDNQFDIEAVNTVQIMSGVSSMFIQAFRNGITRFKIAGRTMTDEVLREDLHFYYDQSMKELKNV